jgi:hypothetical protein
MDLLPVSRQTGGLLKGYGSGRSVTAGKHGDINGDLLVAASLQGFLLGDYPEARAPKTKLYVRLNVILSQADFGSSFLIEIFHNDFDGGDSP